MRLARVATGLPSHLPHPYNLPLWCAKSRLLPRSRKESRNLKRKSTGLIPWKRWSSMKNPPLPYGWTRLFNPMGLTRLPSAQRGTCLVWHNGLKISMRPICAQCLTRRRKSLWRAWWSGSRKSATRTRPVSAARQPLPSAPSRRSRRRGFFRRATKPRFAGFFVGRRVRGIAGESALCLRAGGLWGAGIMLGSGARVAVLRQGVKTDVCAESGDGRGKRLREDRTANR